MADPLRVGLFVPCFIDQLFPRVAWATVEVLERHGCEVEVPPRQTCCGQILLNGGDALGATSLAERFCEAFGGHEHIVAPSASCVAMVRRHHAALLGKEEPIATRTFELCEFLVEVLGVERVDGRFPHRVGVHPSCHGLRELRLGSASERAVDLPDPARLLLGSLEGLELVTPERSDECCGFGGSFALTEAAVSGLMGRDRLRAHAAAGAEVLTAIDMSCLAHLDGIARRARDPVRVLHVAEILAGASR